VSRWRAELRYLIGDTPWDSGVSPPELLAVLDVLPPGRALDVGCGTGTNLVSFALRGWRAWGVDLSQMAVWRARARLARRGLPGHVFRGDVSEPLEFPEPFDLVLDLGCSHSLEGDRRALYADNLERWVRPGGTLLVYSFYRHDKSDMRWLPLDDVLATFAPSFELKTLEKGDFRGRASAWLTFEKGVL
jgi:SAM-dependent methyltransferase